MIWQNTNNSPRDEKFIRGIDLAKGTFVSADRACFCSLTHDDLARKGYRGRWTWNGVFVNIVGRKRRLPRLILPPCKRHVLDERLKSQPRRKLSSTALFRESLKAGTAHSKSGGGSFAWTRCKLAMRWLRFFSSFPPEEEGGRLPLSRGSCSHLPAL